MKKIYRVSDRYSHDELLFTGSKETAEFFAEAYNKKPGNLNCTCIDEILLEVPCWDEDKDCLPRETL